MKKSLVVPAVGIAAVAGLVSARRSNWPVPSAPYSLLKIAGEQIHYRDEGSGPAILLIHGLAVHLHSWRKVFPELSAAHRVVAFDLPGFGFSHRDTEQCFSLDCHARRAVSVLDALGIDTATIVGHSMGGAIAQHIAAAIPERVSSLVLVASADASQPSPASSLPGLWGGVTEVGTKALFKFPRLLEFWLRRGLKRQVVDESLITDELVQAYGAPLLLPGTADCLGRLTSDVGEEPPLDLARIRARTLVLSGEQDPLIKREVGEGLAASIGNAEHVVLPATGHLIPEERPDELGREILRLAVSS